MAKITLEEKNLTTMSKANNYNRWMFSNLQKYVGKRILEVGGGIGNMTQFFIKRELVVSTDINCDNVSKLNVRFNKRKNFKAFLTDISRKTVDVENFHFDTVICINVLEHIKDDLKTLKNMKSVLVPGGKLVLLVPAFNALYGTVDKADMHYRRYNKKSLTKKVELAGFKVIKKRYMNVPGFFGWYYHGKILKAGVHPESDISLFDKLVPFFAFVERIVPPPFGLSLIIIAEKR